MVDRNGGSDEGGGGGDVHDDNNNNYNIQSGGPLTKVYSISSSASYQFSRVSYVDTVSLVQFQKF